MIARLIATAVQLMLSAVSLPQQDEAGGNDIRAALEAHLTRLCPISAKATRKCEYSHPGTPQDSLDWLSQHYDGNLLDWRRDTQAGYMLEMSPQGTQLTGSRFAGGATTTYNYADRRASKQEFCDWPSDLCPEAYFLYTPPVPFRHFLSTAQVAGVTEHEQAFGSTDVLIVHNPGLDHDQRLRIALSRDPMRILQIDWSFHKPGGKEVVVERYRFSEWTTVNGEQFPRAHYKDLTSGSVVTTTRSLRLTELGADPVPNDLLVSSGSTYSSPETDSHSILVGRLSSKDLADALLKLVSWAEHQTRTELFVHPSVELQDSINALERSRHQYPDLPLLSGDASFECGPNCLALAMALQLGSGADYGVVASLSEMARDRGSSVQEIANAASKAGLHSAAIRGTLPELLSYKEPMILPVKIHQSDALPGHFMLLAGTSEGVPILMNPPSPAFVVNLDWLRVHWDGDALILARNPIREPRSHWIVVVLAGAMVCILLLLVGLKWKPPVARPSLS